MQRPSSLIVTLTMSRPFRSRQVILPMLTTLLGKNSTWAQEMLEEILGTNLNKIITLEFANTQGNVAFNYITEISFYSVDWWGCKKFYSIVNFIYPPPPTARLIFNRLPSIKAKTPLKEVHAFTHCSLNNTLFLQGSKSFVFIRRRKRVHPKKTQYA